MLRLLNRQLSLFVLSFILLIGVLMAAAMADKAVKSIVFDAANDGISIAAIYETTPETQKEIVSSVLKSSKSFFKKAPGFDSFSLLQSEDGTRVMTLTQWADAASYEASLAQPTEDSAAKSSKKGKDEKATVAPTKTVVFQVDQTLAPAGMMAAIRGKDALVEFVEVTANSVEDVPKLLTAAEEQLPSATQMYPAPRSAILFKGVDSSDMALLANWGYAEEFEDLTLVPSLALLPDETDLLAASEDHLYEVVKIISAKPEKSKAEKD
jgi:heme-degrading monooxygenase HmoA